MARRSLWAIVSVGLGLLVAAHASRAISPRSPILKASPANQSVTEPGNEACSGCHAAIAATYETTVMARASGPAVDGLITGEFAHKKSGVSYRVFQQDGRVWMSYERSKENFRGQRELLYFIGSGVKGRAYLFSDRDFFFETPINWYGQEHRWNMTPAYTDAREIPMNLPAVVDCLNCHTSGMQIPVAGTDSKFAGKPFLHDGITCERCHGHSELHANGKGGSVNPAKLAADRRDAICMECHFEGTVAVEQPGKHLYEFQPGDRLADYDHYFLLAGGPPAEKPEAVSQVEAFELSACKRKSGDKMWCGTCHDSHYEPAAAEKAAYYRAKCLSCHGDAFAAKHHADKPDCTACHMPALPNQAVAHTQSTDHRIMRRPNGFQLPASPGEERLVAYPASDAPLTSTRDLALAWEKLEERNHEGAVQKAEQYLRKAVKDYPNDARILAGLGFNEEKRGHDQQAREFYERALKADPVANDVATNLATLEARAGHLQRAVALWQAAFGRAPQRSEIGMDLAMTFCAAGQKDEARQYVTRVLEFNPDSAMAKRLKEHLEEDPVKCRP